MTLLSKDEIDMIRGTFSVPQGLSDAEIDAVAEELMEAYRKQIHVMVGNKLELNEIKDKALSGVQLKGEFLERLRLTELDGLFTEGYYTDCCVAARSVLEYMLQNDCLEGPQGLYQVREEIDRPGERNPGIYRLYNAQKKEGIWDQSEDAVVNAVIDNGDWATHMRYDQITQGKEPEDYKMGKVHVAFSVEGFKVLDTPDRLTYEFNRSMEARRMAKESLTNLYELVARHRHDTS